MGTTLTTVQCPHCNSEVSWCQEEAFRPFCSERCRLIDLGHWVEESYKVPDEQSTELLPNED